jgi:hypothetical protein
VDGLSLVDMPLRGLVLNRVQRGGATPISAQRAEAAAEQLAQAKEHPLTAQLLRLHADREQVAERQAALALRFTAAHPDVPVVRVPACAEDVHDLDGLREVGQGLAG